MRSFSFIFTDRLFHDYRSIFITIAQGGASAKCYCASNYFQIVFWGIFNLCLLENGLFAGSLHISINEKCHSYESFLGEWKRFFMRQTQRKKMSYKIVAHAMNPQDTHAPVQKTRGTGTTWARHLNHENTKWRSFTAIWTQLRMNRMQKWASKRLKSPQLSKG